MLNFIIAIMAFAIAAVQAQSYELKSTYDATNWLTAWQFEDGPDPTGGTVSFQNLSSAEALGLVKILGNQVYMTVDNTTVIPTDSKDGRKSLWLESMQTYTHYLLIIDAEHMPGNDCGSWPAFWSINNDIAMGEIDIIEYANTQDFNDMTLYTQNPCEFSPRVETGTVNNNNCDENNDGDSGCDTYGGLVGTGFNNVGGGVYATLWDSSGIEVFFFQRSAIPSDIASGNPNPSSWGTPLASFQQSDGGCNIDQNFLAQTIYFDHTFCGASAGATAWTSDPVCSKLAPTCEEYVRATPEAYDDAYWLINSVKVYQDMGDDAAGISKTPLLQPYPGSTT